MPNLYDLGLGNYTFNPEGRVDLKASDPPLTHYKMHWFMYNWVPCLATAGLGCAPVARARLSLEKPAPPLRDQPPPPPPPPPPGPKKAPLTESEKIGNAALAVVNGMDAFSRWWNAPPPPNPFARRPAAPASATAPAAPEEGAIPKFDLQDIPDTMEKISLPVAAKMMRHWFAGRANYSRTRDDVVNGIDQNGKPFEPDMINDSILTLDWLLRFAIAKKAHDKLLETDVYSERAANIIRKHVNTIIACRAKPFTSLNGWVDSGRNVDALHRNFQFQLVKVESPVADMAVTLINDKVDPVHGVNDLTAALGNFFLYAALGDISITRRWNTKHAVRVESVYVYARDSYSFLDEKENASQYLGHWSSKAIFLVPMLATYKGGVGPWISAPLVDVKASIYEKGAIMYPVSNASYREWRERHHQGGDFLAYTPPKRIPLEKAIVLDL